MAELWFTKARETVSSGPLPCLVPQNQLRHWPQGAVCKQEMLGAFESLRYNTKVQPPESYIGLNAGGRGMCCKPTYKYNNKAIETKQLGIGVLSLYL